MAFDTTQKEFTQEHFTIIEVDVPAVTGTCTLGGSPGYGTALSCDQPSNATKTYKFTNYAGVLPESGIYKCIASISETPTELKSGRGLASRGTLSITLEDFQGDPNPEAPGVTPEVRLQGGFLAKLDARNILQNREVRIKNYRIVNDTLPDLANDAQIRYYLVDTFKSNGKAKFSLSCKDELSRVDIGEKVFPEPNEGFLRQDISDTGLTFQVDANSDYAVGDVVRIGDELILISSVSGIGGGSATFTTSTRGATIDGIHETEKSAHDAGDEVFICKRYTNATINDVLEDMVESIGIDPVYIPSAEWASEVSTWHPTTTVSALFVEADDANDVISAMLQSYLLDMWFDPVARLIKLSAISVWQSSSKTLTEGAEIDFDSVRRSELEDLRATDSLVVYGKQFKAKDNAIENYRKASLYSNPKLLTDTYYGESKQKRFDNNPIIDSTAADLLVRRYVSRYGLTPQSYTWKTQENKLSFETGDIVSLVTSAKVGFDGSPNSSARAQIISVKPNYNNTGRDYTVKALTYDPAITDGGGVTELIIAGNQQNINLFVEAGGAIPAPVEITFIIDGAKIRSNSRSTPALRAGDFPPGSKIILILVNNADLQSKGGDGGSGGLLIFDDESGTWQALGSTDGKDGGIVYDANGIDTDIYFSGPTPSGAYPEANGFIRAPGGGGGATASNPSTVILANGGGGGAGNDIGIGGLGGRAVNGTANGGGIDGASGTIQGAGGVGFEGAGNGGGWGQNGVSVAGGTSGGLAGKGVVDSDATVTFFGDTPTRYINGRGDH